MALMKPIWWLYLKTNIHRFSLFPTISIKIDQNRGWIYYSSNLVYFEEYLKIVNWWKLAGFKLQLMNI